METKMIFKAMSNVMKDIGHIGKGQYNSFDKYKFRGIDDMYNAIQPALVKHGVFCVPNIKNTKTEIVQTSQGKQAFQVILEVEYTFYADDGSSVTASVVGEAMDRGDKAVNKAMSAAMKYAMLQIFCIPTEEQKDSEFDTYEIETNEKKTLNKEVYANKNNKLEFIKPENNKQNEEVEQKTNSQEVMEKEIMQKIINVWVRMNKEKQEEIKSKFSKSIKDMNLKEKMDLLDYLEEA